MPPIWTRSLPAGLYKVGYDPEYSWEHADLNVQKFPLDDVKVRKALYSATDKKSIIDSLYFGKYVAAELPGAVLPTNSWAYTTDFVKVSVRCRQGQGSPDRGRLGTARPCPAPRRSTTSPRTSKSRS